MCGGNGDSFPGVMILSKPEKPLVGKDESGIGVPTAELGVLAKAARVGNDKCVKVPIRSGPGSGRAGGGATGETPPGRDTAAQRGYGEKR